MRGNIYHRLRRLKESCVSGSSHRVLGGVGDEQGHSWISPGVLHRWPSSRLAAPPSGGGRGGHSWGAGARPVLVLYPQWRHGKDPAGRPARIKPQQLLL